MAELRAAFAGKSNLDRLRYVVGLMAEDGKRVTRIRLSARDLCHLESFVSHQGGVKSSANGLLVTMLGSRVALALNMADPKSPSVIFEFESMLDSETKGWSTIEDFGAL